MPATLGRYLSERAAAGYQRWSQVIADHLVPWAEFTDRNR
jgi:hypothetical protein